MKRALITPGSVERFWAKVKLVGECWEWTGAKVGRGYGHFTQGGADKMILAHRWSYEYMVAAIPVGLEIDHLCRNKACVRPDHLEPVPHAENIARNPNAVNHRRPTHCPDGHEYSQGNTRVDKRGRRSCRACGRKHSAAYRARRDAA